MRQNNKVNYLKGIIMKNMIIFLFILFVQSFGQTEILNEYISYGLKNNLALKQKQFSLDQSLTDLKEARGMFFPSIGVNSRYTRAGGGRIIDIPVGDFVNPVNQGLNSLLPGSPYPTNIPNQQTKFLREKEHDTKISLVQPIIQPALFYNYSIRSNLSEIKLAEKNIYTRNLIADIQTAYYNYLKAEQVKLLYENTLLLLEENLRVSNSLLKNDKVTIDIVYRAKAELSEIEQKKLEADNDSDITASYFNFLLNKPLDSKIIIDSILVNNIVIPSLNDLETNAVNHREELTQLSLAIETAGDNKGLAKSNYYPGLALAVDYGFQGEQYKFSKDDDYWMASVVLNWNIFNGFQDEAKSEKAEIEIKTLKARYEELKNMIRLQIKESFKNFVVATKTIEATNERYESYSRSFDIMKKKYKAGIASQLEYLDSQNKFIQSEMAKIIAEYNVLDTYSQLEKAAALIDLNNFN